MSETLQALVLGVLQGATEFLPVSSSAHLLLVPWLLGWLPMGLTFDVLLHGGTLLALLVYFRDDWKQMRLRDILRREPGASRQNRLGMTLLIGTLPAALAGSFFENLVEEVLRSPTVTVLTLSCFGLLLWWADRTGARTRQVTDLSPPEGLIVGTAQALALVPGVSRSGVTMTAALLLGLSRAEAARFSFLLGTPIIALATLSRIQVLWTSGGLDLVSLLPFLVGIIFSFVSGFLCIEYLLRFLRSRSYFPFVAYRLLLAAFIFWCLVA